MNSLFDLFWEKREDRVLLNKYWICFFLYAVSYILFIALEITLTYLGYNSYKNAVSLLITKTLYLTLSVSMIFLSKIFFEDFNVKEVMKFSFLVQIFTLRTKRKHSNKSFRFKLKFLFNLAIFVVYGLLLNYFMINSILYFSDEPFISIDSKINSSSALWVLAWIAHSTFEELNKMYWLKQIVKESNDVRRVNLRLLLKAMFVSSSFFMLWHIGNPGITLLSLFNLFVLSNINSLSCILFNNFWCSVITHTFWNFLIANVLDLNLSGLVNSENSNDFGFEASGNCTFVSLSFFLALFLCLIYKRAYFRFGEINNFYKVV